MPLEPNLFVIGSMKSGTTYLHDLLGAHPSIFMCRPKEPSYFVEPDQLRKIWPWGWEQGYWRSEKHYLQLFQSAGTATILGEASVHYTYLPLASGVSERIKQFNSDARLIYVMRDPIERTISHYWHRARHLGEYRSIYRAIRNDPQYRDVSNYAMQLEPYFERFKQDQIKLITFEKLIGNPTETIGSIFQWLNLGGSHQSVFTEPENVTPSLVYMPVWPRGSSHHNRLFPAVLELVPRSVRRFSRRLFTRGVERRGVDLSEVVRYLRPVQQRQTEMLMKMTGRSYPEWTTLNARVDEVIE
jgi:hypothetical protein